MPRMDQTVYDKAYKYREEIKQRLDNYDKYGRVGDLHFALEASQSLEKLLLHALRDEVDRIMEEERDDE